MHSGPHTFNRKQFHGSRIFTGIQATQYVDRRASSQSASSNISFISHSTDIDSIAWREIENIFVNEKSRFLIGILGFGF